MKKSIFITIIFSFIFLFANSQNFIQENKSWNVVECMNFGGCGTHSFKISGDTTIGQVDYKKLYSTYDTALINWSIYGALRENENQVFIYNFYHESEELLYDFNLSVGDTFSTTANTPDYNGCPIELLVTSIDTIIFENGEPKQRYNFMGEQWISGVGSLYGLIYVGVGQCIFDMYYDLSCCHENDELIFQSSIFDGCFVYTVGLEENSKHIQHSLFPNPFSVSTILKFDFSNLQNYRLQIINGNGQMVREINDITTGEITIQGNQLTSGIYYYRLISGGNECAKGILIKE